MVSVIPVNTHLVGGIPTPLKNMSSSVTDGVMKFQLNGKS